MHRTRHALGNNNATQRRKRLERFKPISMIDRFLKETVHGYWSHSTRVPEPADQHSQIIWTKSHCVPAAPPLLVLPARIIIRYSNNSQFGNCAIHVNIPPTKSNGASSSRPLLFYKTSPHAQQSQRTISTNLAIKSIIPHLRQCALQSSSPPPSSSSHPPSQLPSTSVKAQVSLDNLRNPQTRKHVPFRIDD